MHRRSTLALFLLLAALPLRALTLDDVRRSLSEFPGASPLRVKIDAHDRRNDGKKKLEGTGSSVAEDDGTHLRLVHDKSELRKQAQKKDRTDTGVGAGETLDLMNYAPKLLDTLKGATLKKVTPTSLDGVPATLLEIVPVREKDEDGDKWIKQYNDTLLLWVGAGNVPLAAERTLKIKARIVVIPAEFAQHEKFRFTRTADRLLVTKRTTESNGSGFGQSENSVKSTTLSVLR